MSGLTPGRGDLDQALRSALHLAVDSVEPGTDGLDQIQAKIAARQAARSRLRLNYRFWQYLRFWQRLRGRMTSRRPGCSRRSLRSASASGRIQAGRAGSAGCAPPLLSSPACSSSPRRAWLSLPCPRQSRRSPTASTTARQAVTRRVTQGPPATRSSPIRTRASATSAAVHRLSASTEHPIRRYRRVARTPRPRAPRRPTRPRRRARRRARTRHPRPLRTRALPLRLPVRPTPRHLPRHRRHSRHRTVQRARPRQARRCSAPAMRPSTTWSWHRPIPARRRRRQRRRPRTRHHRPARRCRRCRAGRPSPGFRANRARAELLTFQCGLPLLPGLPLQPGARARGRGRSRSRASRAEGAALAAPPARASGTGA